jgi:hypothetical protein
MYWTRRMHGFHFQVLSFGWLLSSDHSSWLQIQRSGFDSRRYQIFREVVGLERCTLSLVSTTEELLEQKSSGPCLDSREYDRMDHSRWPPDTLYPEKLALTSPTSGIRSVGIVRSRTQAKEIFFIVKRRKFAERLRCKWAYINMCKYKMCIKEIKTRDTNWIHLAQNSDEWWASVRTVINILFPQTPGYFVTSWATISFSGIKFTVLKIMKSSKSKAIPVSGLGGL